jgi:hypothetical protein
MIGCDADGPHLSGLVVNAYVQFAPLTTALSSMLFALPFAFAQELDACGVKQ